MGLHAQGGSNAAQPNTLDAHTQDAHAQGGRTQDARNNARAERSRNSRPGALPTAFVALHFILMLVPLITLVVWSFTASWPAPELLPQNLSLKGYEDIFRPSRGVGPVLLQSVGIALATALITTIIAALAARAVTQYAFKGREVFKFATILPFLIPTTVFAMGVQVVFLNVGLARTLHGVVLSHCIVALPYAIVIMTDVTAAAGTRLEEAAKCLGARPLEVLRSVTIPSLVPGVLSAVSMSYIISFSQYFLTLVIGGGAVKTYALMMFPYLTGGDRTIASAYGVVFLAVTFAVFLLIEWALKRLGLKEEQNLFNL